MFKTLCYLIYGQELNVRIYFCLSSLSNYATDKFLQWWLKAPTNKPLKESVGWSTLVTLPGMYISARRVNFSMFALYVLRFELQLLLNKVNKMLGENDL